MAKYWRCKGGCHEVWLSGGPGVICGSCHGSKWEPVDVVPAGTVARRHAKRAREAEAKLALVTSALRAYMVADVDADADLHEPDKQAWREWIARWEP